MILEWQPIMPDDVLKFKARTLYEFLHGDLSTTLDVGLGGDEKTPGSDFLTKGVVAWRELDTRIGTNRNAKGDKS